MMIIQKNCLSYILKTLQFLLKFIANKNHFTMILILKTISIGSNFYFKAIKFDQKNVKRQVYPMST